MSRLGVGEPLDRVTVVHNWVRRRLGSVAHELRVSRNARMLFTLTQRWHSLDAGDCRMLLLGAMVHDVGRVAGEKRHAQNGARMVLEHAGLPLSETERRRAAYLTRYHRGKVPAAGAEAFLDHDLDDSFTMRVLLGLLRTADALDSRTLGTPQLMMTARSGGERVVMIHGYVECDVRDAEEMYARPKKFRLLEEVLNCRVRPQWFEDTALVA